MLRNAAAKDLGPLCPAARPQRSNCSPSFRALAIYTPRLSRLKTKEYLCLITRNTRSGAATTVPASDPTSNDPGKCFHAWNCLSINTVDQAVKHYDGTKSKLNSMVASLLIFFGATDFILTLALSHYATLPDPRVPGLHIRYCAGSSNNLAPRCPKLSAIDVTEKALFERLYLVPGPRQFAPYVTMPSAPTPPPLSHSQRLFLDFRAIFFSSGPQFF